MEGSGGMDRVSYRVSDAGVTVKLRDATGYVSYRRKLSNRHSPVYIRQGEIQAGQGLVPAQ